MNSYIGDVGNITNRIRQYRGIQITLSGIMEVTMKSTAIEIQKLKKVFRVFPYKFTRNDGEFVSYLDEHYLKTSMQTVITDEIDTLINTANDENITYKLHTDREVSAVIRLEKHNTKVYGDGYIDYRENRYTYLCLEVVDKVCPEHKGESRCKYLIPSSKAEPDSLLRVLDLNIEGCTLISGDNLDATK